MRHVVSAKYGSYEVAMANNESSPCSLKNRYVNQEAARSDWEV